MALPKLDQATFTLTIPSTKEEVTYRSFLVKEEKVLLIALESGEPKDISRAVKQIIQNCTISKLDVDSLASFDLEYFFLKLRAKSISETADLRYQCQEDDCDGVVEFNVDLNKVEVVENEAHTNKIELDKGIGLIMKLPTVDNVQGKDESKFDDIMSLIIGCIDNIYDANNVYNAKDSTKKELQDWVEGLSREHFLKIKDYFETMPKLSHTTKVTCPKCKTKDDVVLEGLQSFFG